MDNRDLNKKMKSRDDSLDMARGLAVFLVIVGHMSATPTVLRVWLYTFHLPLFFALSGMFLSKDRYGSFREFLKSRVRSLLIPYFGLSISLMILVFLKRDISAHTLFAQSDYIHVILSIFLGYRKHEFYFSLWFVAVLFFAELLVYILIQKCGLKVLLLVPIAGCCLQALIFHYIVGFYWSLDIMPAAVSFLCTGYIIKEKNMYTDKWCSLRWLLPAFLGNLAAGFVNYKICGRSDLYDGILGNPIFYYISAFCGIWFILIVCRNYQHSKFFEYLGCNSLIIYAFQNDFSIPVSSDILQKLASRNVMFADPVFGWLFVLAGTICISVVLVEIINRLCPALAGKKR